MEILQVLVQQQGKENRTKPALTFANPGNHCLTETLKWLFQADAGWLESLFPTAS